MTAMSFNVILLYYILRSFKHISDNDQVISELRRALRPQGATVQIVPHWKRFQTYKNSTTK